MAMRCNWSLTSSFQPLTPPYPKPLLLHRRKAIAMSLNQETASTSGLKIGEGNGGLPKISLSSIHGSKADMYLFGGCITSWKLADGKDLLFVRPDAVFNGKKPISGGIPHCFPQFGPGAMQQKEGSWSAKDTQDTLAPNATCSKLI